MNVEENRAILENFLRRWPKSSVEKMQLSEYVGVHDKDTFTYWVETRTRPLGSIKGSYSDKFGIYRRIDVSKHPQNRNNDEEYTWLYKYGETREEAFRSIKEFLLQTINYADSGKFAAIDSIPLTPMFKWKVASLYSNERLVPIFRHETLLSIAEAYGMAQNPQPAVSQIQQLLIAKKPAGADIYSYMAALYERYGRRPRENAPTQAGSSAKERPRRKPSKKKGISPQPRSGTQSYIAEQKHNKIQETLYHRLIAEHGESAVRLEEDWVDIKVLLPAEIILYEIKAAAYASECVRQALGQLIGYLFNDTDARPKRVVIVGQYPPNESERRFIEFVSSILNVQFCYESVDYTLNNNN